MLALILEYIHRLLVTVLVIVVLVAIGLYNSLDKCHFLSMRRWGKAEDRIAPWHEALRAQLTALLPHCSPLHRTQAEGVLAKLEEYPQLSKDYQRCQCCGEILAATRPILAQCAGEDNPELARLDEARRQAETALAEELERFNEAAEKFQSKADSRLYRLLVKTYRGKTYPPLKFPQE